MRGWEHQHRCGSPRWRRSTMSAEARHFAAIRPLGGGYEGRSAVVCLVGTTAVRDQPSFRGTEGGGSARKRATYRRPACAREARSVHTSSTERYSRSRERQPARQSTLDGERPATSAARMSSCRAGKGSPCRAARRSSRSCSAGWSQSGGSSWQVLRPGGRRAHPALVSGGCGASALARPGLAVVQVRPARRAMLGERGLGRPSAERFGGRSGPGGPGRRYALSSFLGLLGPGRRRTVAAMCRGGGGRWLASPGPRTLTPSRRGRRAGCVGRGARTRPRTAGP